MKWSSELCGAPALTGSWFVTTNLHTISLPSSEADEVGDRLAAVSRFKKPKILLSGRVHFEVESDTLSFCPLGHMCRV